MINSLLKKERGYALILVLLIITILAIIATPIISNILNSTLQYKKAEQNIQMDRLREMGITYMESVVEQAISKNKYTGSESKDDLENYANKIKSDILQYIPVTKQFKEKGYQFHLEVEPVFMVKDSNIIISYQVTPSLKNTFDDSNTSVEEVIIHFKKKEEK